MKKNFLFLLISILTISVTFAQNKQLTIDEAVSQQYRQFYPDRYTDLTWQGETDNFVFIKDWSELYSNNAKKDDEKLICDLTDINKELRKLKEPKFTYIYGVNWLDNEKFSMEQEGRIIIFDTKKKELEHLFSLSENAENADYFQKANTVAFTVDNNLFLMKKDGKKVAITDEKNKEIVSGNPYTHRQEFGIDKGFWWSPNGNFIAFYRKDETMVADYPIVDYTTKIAENNNEKYPMAGQTSEEVTLGIYNVATKQTVFMKTGKPKDQYLTSITWDPNEKYIYIGVLNRDQNHLKLNKYDVKTGNLEKTLFEETHPKWVEPEHPLYFLKNSPDKFLFYSERDNYNHLYLFNTEGELLQQVTKGEWIVTDFLGFDKKEENIFIMATKESPIESHLYKVEIISGEITKLTKETGTHAVTLSSNKKYFVDSYSSINVSGKTDLLKTDGKLVRNLITSEDKLADYKLGEMKIGTIKSADKKTDLHYRLITPPDFDESKTYPAIIYVYGGPHAQLVTNSWLSGASLWQFYMAQKGYVIFVMDNRGSGNRGLEFENVIHRQNGVAEMEDQMQGVEFLKNLEYVDMDRVGVHGWSYGGFMTSSLLTTYPDVFKVGVAGGPVIDWKYYEVMYGERYMDTPESNPEGYESTSLLGKIKNLKGRLLIIHGGIDPVVVTQNSYQLQRQTVIDDVQIDFFTYPTAEHNVRGKDRIHLMKKVTRYFDDFL